MSTVLQSSTNYMVLREGTSIEVHRLFSPTPNGRQRFIEFFTANMG